MSRFRSALPPFDRGARLPLALAVLLAATLVFQLAVPPDLALPLAGPMHASVAGAGTLPVPPSNGIGRGVRARLFTPPAAPAPSGTGGTGAPPAGPAVLGSIGTGGRRFVLVQAADGHVGRVRPGGAIAGWRLLGIDAGGVRLAHGKDTITVPFGGRVSTPLGAAGGMDR